MAQTRLAISFPVALCIGMGLGENRIFRILNVLEFILLSGKVTGVTWFSSFAATRVFGNLCQVLNYNGQGWEDKENVSLES